MNHQHHHQQQFNSETNNPRSSDSSSSSSKSPADLESFVDELIGKMVREISYEVLVVDVGGLAVVFRIH
jgi:hypothetical protein